MTVTKKTLNWAGHAPNFSLFRLCHRSLFSALCISIVFPQALIKYKILLIWKAAFTLQDRKS